MDQYNTRRSDDDSRAGPEAQRDGLSKGLPGWYLNVFPTAREGSGVFRTTDTGGRGQLDPVDELLALDRAKKAAESRARVKLRRYCAANALNRLGTLTYGGEGCHDPMALRTDVGRFFRQLCRGALGGDVVPRTSGCRSGTRPGTACTRTLLSDSYVR